MIDRRTRSKYSGLALLLCLVARPEQAFAQVTLGTSSQIVKFTGIGGTSWAKARAL